VLRGPGCAASLDWVLQSQGYTTQQYHKHDETIKKWPGHEPVQPDSYTENKNEREYLKPLLDKQYIIAIL
jgi:hypothetical protein